MLMSSNIRYIAKRTRRHRLPFFIFLLTGTFIYSFLPLIGEEHLNSGNSSFTNNITILLWHWPFGTRYDLTGHVCLRDYNISGCILVDNQTLFESADLVVFHHFELNLHKQQLPVHLHRPAKQRWVWLSLEAPKNNGHLSPFKNLFNLTMSYHPGADITMPYGKLILRTNPVLDVIIPKSKRYEACWVISNYKKWHKRSAVFQELNKTLNVQLYGSFGQKPLPKEALLPTISRCYFYLAFENVESPHYITEKLWRNSFQAGTIPVVLGPPRRDYEAIIPSKSFIHVDDFKSIMALSEYLKGLIKDTEKYNAYFSWQQKYIVKLYTDWRERLCNICPLYGQFPAQKVYRDLRAW